MGTGELHWQGFFQSRFHLLLARSAAILFAGVGASVFANERADIRVGGFGTLGYAGDNRNDIAPARDVRQRPRESFATPAGWRLDSRVGVQMEYAADHEIELVGQVVAYDHFRADLDSSTELAYLAFRPLSQLGIRLGRGNYDTFLNSDHRNVGYAYLWVRPPLEFHGWLPILSVNGLDLTYNHVADDVRWRAKAQVGSSKAHLPIGTTGPDRVSAGYGFRTNNLVGISLSREQGPWRIKGAYSQFTVGSEAPILAPLLASLDAVAATGISGLF